MKFLIDQNSACRLAGCAESPWARVKQLDLSTASDHRIWSAAASLGAVIVSKDSDFISFVARGATETALVRLRVGNCANAALYDIVRRAWAGVIDRLEEGETVVEVRA